MPRIPSIPALVIVAAVASLPRAAGAHDLRAGLLDIRALSQDRYSVTFKISLAAGAGRAQLEPRLPPRCADLTGRRVEKVARGAVTRWLIRCPGGLAGTTIAADFGTSDADLLVRVETEGTVASAVLSASRPEMRVPIAGSPARVFRDYVGLGVEHIAAGFDHLLFLLCLLLLCRRSGEGIVWAVTAFTIGHSLSLALVTLGIAGLPAAPVEATIALSVAFLAAELARREPPPIAQLDTPLKIPRRPVGALGLGFGVLHGFGFAGALAQVGLPRGDIPLALLGFNLGVEAGQLSFVLGALALVIALERLRVPLSRSRLLPYGIGSVAGFWLIERVVSFWSGGVS